MSIKFLTVLTALAAPAFSSIITARDDASVAPTSSWTPAWTWYGSGKQCPPDVSSDCPCLTDVRFHPHLLCGDLQLILD